ncbi:extensin family protein [Parvibaculum sp.]|uniref:extensin-like domain-containing protein n=1 Tax=Parvibaculum sp. TaxID=2024848 RepID=UPI000C93D450|nr:extensin family protein [Parvibaculum sp.]MAB13314.1 extensin [Parvibaculum sp.]
MNRWAVAARVALFSGMAFLAGWGLWNLPDSINPFSPLEIADKPTLATPIKMRILEHRPEACVATVRRSRAEVVRAPIASDTQGCGVDDGLTLDRSDVSYGGGGRLSCISMTALLIWERHVAEPAAAEILGSKLTRIVHYGTYQCRNINHDPDARLSYHATGRAIDIAAFVLADGRKISVLKDWGKDTPEGQFLARVHDGACEVFRGVLGPDYNKLHANHFHLEMGRWSFCK